MALQIWYYIDVVADSVFRFNSQMFRSLSPEASPLKALSLYEISLPCSLEAAKFYVTKGLVASTHQTLLILYLSEFATKTCFSQHCLLFLSFHNKKLLFQIQIFTQISLELSPILSKARVGGCAIIIARTGSQVLFSIVLQHLSLDPRLQTHVKILIQLLFKANSHTRTPTKCYSGHLFWIGATGRPPLTPPTFSLTPQRY